MGSVFITLEERTTYAGCFIFANKSERNLEFTEQMLLYRKIGKGVKGTYEIVSQKKYQERYRDVTGRDPFVCKHCAGEMILWKIWHPKFGYIFDEEELIKQDKYGVKEWYEERTGHTVRATARGVQLSMFPIVDPIFETVC